MAKQREPRTEPRAPLTRERVLLAAVRIADERGIEALTMRNLAQELGVEAMSLYYHVANKEEVLDGIVEVVVGETNARVSKIAVPAGSAGWKTAVRQRILSAREVLLAHPWAPGIIESRTSMTPAVLRYFDSLSGVLREGGLSVDLVHHAMHALGSRALGFTQELFDTEGNEDSGSPDVAAVMLAQMANEYPHIAEIVMGPSHECESTLGWCDDQFEFEFGLDLILDGLERLHATASASQNRDASACRLRAGSD